MDPLEQSRVFLDCFAANVNPADPLPVRVPIYNLKSDEIKPAIVDWTRTYLDQFGCPQCILTPIIQQVLEAVLSHCKEKPESCGYTGRDYKTLQLNHEVISRVNQICTALLDNEKLNSLLAQLLEEDQPDSAVATGKKIHFARGLKHRRRTMEDRHVCLPDFSVLFDTKDTEPTAFYGVYDGHGGQEAASFAASHLHYYIAQSVHYPHDMEQAFRDGFHKTDRLFLEKCDNHHLHSGSTAVACVHRLASKQVDVAWVGDSQAILVKRTPGQHVYNCLVYPTHVASDPNERERISSEGGCVIFWEGQYRVNGQVAITRAIGNPYHKPFVSGEPGIALHKCTEDDLLLVMASDGLWEGCDEYIVSMFILYAVRKFPDNPQKITDYLITYAKKKTRDNITVIIVFLKDAQTIIKDTPFIEEIETQARNRNSQNMDINGAANNGFYAENSSIPLEDHKAFEDIQNFMVESTLVKPKSASPLCVGPVDDMGFLSDGGLGPETDVDGVHDSKQQSPSPLLVEEGKSPVLGNGDAVHDFVSSLEQNIDSYNPFGLPSDVIMESPSNVPEDISNEIDEEASSVSAEPIDLSEEQSAPETPHLNGTGEHHFDERAEAGEIIGAGEEEDSVPVMKSELNENELVPLKSVDEPIVNDLLGGDSIVDNKLIDQLDSFGISDAIRRQLIEQQVTGAAMNQEQEEDDDEGQLMEAKESEFDGGDDGAEKEDLHHEKAFDSDNVNDHHSADVKQDDDAGCCEDSEEDEWDYVKVNQQQEQQQQLEQQQLEQQQTQEKPQESTPPEQVVEFGDSNSLATEELLETHSEEQEHEVDQHSEQEVEQEKETPQQWEEKTAEQYQAQELDVEQQHNEIAASDTSVPSLDILGDNTESTVSESTKEVDDVIIGAEAKEVVNLLNEFEEDVPQPTAIETLCDTSDVNEEDSVAVPLALSDSMNMETSMYGGSVGEQPLSPDSPVSPVVAFHEQQQQQFSEEKDLFGSSMDDTMSPTGGEELKEKHLYETEEKVLAQGVAGDLARPLNPDAKEFVPIVTPTGEPTNVFPPSRMMEHENFKLRDDAIVAQSPRKGTGSSMEDLDLPAERDFHTEMDKRPHEFEADMEANGTPKSPLSPNPFDQLDESNVEQVENVTNGVESINGGGFSQQSDADLLSYTKPDLVQFGASEEFELLNKVQELPAGDEEEQQQQLIASQYSEPVQASMPEKGDLAGFVMETEPYSVKEGLYVEQKETVDEPMVDVSPVVVHDFTELVHDFNQLSLNSYTDRTASNPFVQEDAFVAITSSLGVTQAVNDMLGMDQPPADSIQVTTEATEAMVTEEEPLPSHQQSALEALVPTSLPSSVFDQESSAPAAPELSPEVVASTPIAEPSEVSAELSKENDVLAASGVAVGAAVLAGAAVAATAVSKTAKSKAPTAAPAKKAALPSTGTKPTSAVSKDSAAKTATTAARPASTTTAAPASRKAPIPAVKKAPTTTARPAVGASTNGVKEARPASATANRPSLAPKKPATTDAAKTATTKTTPGSSVAAARTKAATVPPSTTKPASASSTTRSVAPKPAPTGTTAAVKSTSRLSTTGAPTRTVTSRPSSAVSTTSVPSKPSGATTTNTVKKSVAAKPTNGTTATDGLMKTTKTTNSTTSSSAASRTGVTRATGTGTAKTSSTLAAKKPLDAKPAPPRVTSTTGANKPATTARTSLAPKTTATSPAARKVQQNGVAKKTTASSPMQGSAMKKVTIPTKKQEALLSETTTSTTTTTTIIETNGSANGCEELVVAPQSADQLLVPVPQAM